MRFPRVGMPVLVGLALLISGCGPKADVDTTTPDKDPAVDTTTAPPSINLGTEVDPHEATPPADPNKPDDTSPIDPPPGDSGQAPTTPAKPLVASGELKDVGVEQLVASLADESQRDAASRELAVRGEAALAPLVKALQSDDAELQAGAAFTLSRMGAGAQGALDELQKLADAAKNEAVRDSALFAIDAVKGN